MSEKADESRRKAEERIAERKARDGWLKAGLAGRDLDGPHETRSSGDMFGGLGLFGGGPTRFAVCLRCGAMVLLDDAEPSEDDPAVMIERSVKLHLNWHDKATS